MRGETVAMAAAILSGAALLVWILVLQIANASNPNAVSWRSITAVYLVAVVWALATAVILRIYCRGGNR